MKKLFLSFLVIIILNQINYCIAQVDSCLKLYCPNDYNILSNSGSYNQDSVKIDSCIVSPSFGKLFAKKYFELKFTQYPFDSLIGTNDLKRVSDLSESITGLKEQLEDLESELGVIYFKRFSFNDVPDSNWLLNNGYLTIYFENYQDIENVIELFKTNIDSLIDIQYLPRYGFPASVPNDIALEPNIKQSEVYLEWDKERDFWSHSWSEFYPPNWEPFGFQSNIYEVNCPMAWEITHGSGTITLAISDYWDNPTEHPDVYQNYFYPMNFGNGWRWDPLYTGHGLACMSNAVAIEDNGYPMVGTAPRCRAISILAGRNAILFDVDESSVGNVFRYSDVKSCSYGSSSTMSREDIDSGIVVVAAAGNDRFRLTGGGGRVTDQKPDGSFEVLPTKLFPAATIYTDVAHPENPILDYKIIAVEATMSGVLHNKYCEPWGAPYQQIGPNFTREVQFADVGNFSPGIQKFNNSATTITRIEEKEKAFVDLVAPGKGILVAAESNPLKGSCDNSYTPGTVDWFNCKLSDLCITINTLPDDIDFYMSSSSTISYTCNSSTFTYGHVQARLLEAFQDARKYAIWNGTSHATPMVSGIAALMLSVNKFMGVHLKADGKPGNGNESYGADVQRRVYNALTFTAKKIPDFENFSTEKFTVPNNPNTYFYSNSFPSGEGYQYDYKTQWNDNLKRSWAQRVGFGLVNAYRAVAHSIRQKGAYEYNLASSSTLTFDFDDGTGDSRGYQQPDMFHARLMHWGGIVNEGNRPFELPADWRGPTTANDDTLLVLEWGGVSLPGEFHNNNGVTRVNHNGNSQQITISVPDNCILAIDGILTSDQPNLSHIVTTSSTFTYSKILMEGYLNDVEIYGNLRIGDLTVVSTTNDISGCVGFGANVESEIYGRVTLKNYGMLYSWGGCRLRPGAYIDMQGSQDIILHDGSYLALEYGTTITGIPGRKIIIKDGSMLWIESDSKVDLLCEVVIESGGTLIINGNAVVRANKITVQKDADLMVFSGSVLSLNEPEQFWDGRININGTTDNKAQVIGMLKETCLPINDVLYTDFNYIYTSPSIYMRGSCQDDGKTALNAIEAAFKNISIETNDATIVAINSDFLTSTRITNPYLNFPYLFSVNYNNCQECEKEEYKDFYIEDCSFRDVSGYEPHPTEPVNWNKRIYRTGGLLVNGLEGVEISDCIFENLEFGVATYDCDNVKIENSDFSFCGIGDYDFGSNTTLCSNNYYQVQFGSVRDHSLIGKAFDNWYWLSRVAFGVVSSTEQRFRGNHFQEYLIGISSTCSDITLSGYPTFTIYGRNRFDITNFPTNIEDYTNKFLTKDCEIPFTTDINLIKSCCNLSMQYGHNKMSSYAVNHIRYNGPGYFPNTVNITSNAMMPYAIPRTSLVTPLYDQGSLGESEYWSSEIICGDYAEENLIINNITQNNNFINIEKSKDLGDLDFKDILLYYDSFKNERDVKNSLIKFNNTILENQSNMSDDIREEINIIKADIALKLGDKEKASEILSGIDESMGGILRLKAGDKEQGTTGSGLLKIVSNSLNVQCNDSQTETEEALPGLEFALEQNKPNPFSNSTDIEFTLPVTTSVTLVITDMYGNKISTLINNSVQSPGRHKVTFDTEGIASGVYVYSLFANGSVFSKLMHVVK
jgi:subtilisin family serine protease